MYGSLRAATNTWLTYAHAHSEAYAAISHAVMSFTHSKLRAALNSWIEFAETRLNAAEAMEKALRSMHPDGHLMRCAFNSWSAAAMLQGSLSRALSALSLRSERLAFNSWSANAEQSKVQRASIESAVMSMLHGSLRAALNTWGAYVDEASEARRVMMVAAKSFNPEGRLVRSAWNSWSGTAALCVSMHRACSALTLRSERLAFNSWSANAQLHKAQRTAMRAAVMSMLHGSLLSLIHI